ncbi:MAG: hypothetical protein KKH60_01770 [Proteobacteria bacterium]|nr:hypothetical protein [Pseudomonadota bacterium]MBU1420789.1 hypothetical protein [Pseudomonadota bacterium]
MYELKINHQACNGLTSCGLCNEYIPGLITEHNGKLPVREADLNLISVNITAALEDCPTGALILKESENE